MKSKLKLLVLFILGSLIPATIFSCTTDESTEPSNAVAMQQSNEFIQELKAQFLIIEKSSEYLTSNKLIDQIALKMNYQSYDFKTRGEFENWLKSNVSLTNFESVNAALAMYDDCLDKFTILHKKYESFYSSLATLNGDEIMLVCESEFDIDPITTDPLASPALESCVNLCIAVYELDIAANNRRWVEYMSNQTQFEILMFALIAKNKAEEKIAAQYNVNVQGCYEAYGS